MKAKPVLLILITLVIGFILGMLVSAQIRFHRLKPVRVFFSEERFREGFYNILQPDEKQTQIINQILSKYGKSNTIIINDFRRKSDSLMKEFWKEIEPALTREQIERLKEMDKRRMEMIRRDRRNPGDSARSQPGRIIPPPGYPPRDFKHGHGTGRRIMPLNDSADHSRM